MASSPAAKKLRIYEVAKDLGMSSEVIQQIAKKLGVEVKNHMSTLPADIVEKVRAELGKEKAAVREVVVRQQEHEAQRARDDRQRAVAAQQAAQNAQIAAAQAGRAAGDATARRRSRSTRSSPPRASARPWRASTPRRAVASIAGTRTKPERRPRKARSCACRSSSPSPSSRT